MSDIVKGLTFPIVLSVIGAFFVLLGIAGNVELKGITIKMPPGRQKGTTAFGIILVLIGVVVYVLPGTESTPAITLTPTPTPTPTSTASHTPTATPIPPTDTPPRAPDTLTPEPPTNTPVPPPTATLVPPPTNTSIPPPADTPVPPPTDTPVPPPTNTPIPPPTDTPVPPPTNTPVPPPTDTLVPPPTNTPVPPPTDTPPQAISVSWEFETEGDTEGWTHGGAGRLRDTTANNGSLVAHIWHNDPFWVGPVIALNANSCRELRIRYRINAANVNPTMQFMWKTDISGSSWNWIEFGVNIDNSWQEKIIYNLHDENFGWEGTVTQLRIDPVKDASDGIGGSVEIDYVRLCPP